MGSCRILHDAHMFCFIHLVENHPKNHYLIIIIFSSININSTYVFLPPSKPVSLYPSSLLRSVVPLFKEILRKLDVVKEQLCVHNDGPDNAVYRLWGVRLLVLHAEWVTQHLEDL